MTDQAPELLRTLRETRQLLERLLVTEKREPEATWLRERQADLVCEIAALTRPTPSERPAGTRIVAHEDCLNCRCGNHELCAGTEPRTERPVAQMREAMQSYPDLPEAIRSNLIDIELFVNDVDAEDIDVESAVNAFNRLVDGIRALTSERPSESAVAWRWKPHGASNWILEFDEPKHPSAEPLYAIQHGDAVRAQTIEECAKIAELNFALRFTNFDKRDAVRKALADVAKAIRALSPAQTDIGS